MFARVFRLFPAFFLRTESPLLYPPNIKGHEGYFILKSVARRTFYQACHLPHQWRWGAYSYFFLTALIRTFYWVAIPVCL